jgi:hypothetical protein
MLALQVRRTLFALGLIGMVLSQPVRSQTPVPPSRTMSTAEFDALFQKLSNWGRWGRADQIGSLNLLTPKTRLAASKLIRDGNAVSLSRAIETDGEATPQRPSVLRMLATATTPNVTAHTEEITVAAHGGIYTHFDAPSHFFYNGHMYNGVPRAEVTERGAARLSVNHARRTARYRAVEEREGAGTWVSDYHR